MKPVIIFVDDETRNLTVFEATIPDGWTLFTYDNATDALKDLKKHDPWVIVSDQRMPTMTGLEFLELSSQITPEAVRIVVTGQTEEQTMVQLIRRAKIFDFISKPWQPENFLSQLEKAVDYFRINRERNLAFGELKSKNEQLGKMTEALKIANDKEILLRKEISAWAPAPIVDGITSGTVKMPSERDIVGITYDIIDSASIASKKTDGGTLRGHVGRIFTECLLKHGGLVESASGDSMYGHFGAVDSEHEIFGSALAAAQEFRVGLRSFSEKHGVQIECGIALHFIPKALIQMHEIKVIGLRGELVQKSFSSESPEIDLLHRVEKLLHRLPGSNIGITSDYLKGLKNSPPNLVDLGQVQDDRMERPLGLYLLPSYFIKKEDIDAFIKEFANAQSAPRKAA